MYWGTKSYRIALLALPSTVYIYKTFKKNSDANILLC